MSKVNKVDDDVIKRYHTQKHVSMRLCNSVLKRLRDVSPRGGLTTILSTQVNTISEVYLMTKGDSNPWVSLTRVKGANATSRPTYSWQGKEWVDEPVSKRAITLNLKTGNIQYLKKVKKHLGCNYNVLMWQLLNIY